jgi:hypothetical protein
MFFYHVELILCKRFPLRDIASITIRPTLKTQMVLGSNGAGKSSLLKVGFNVLPGLATDFHKGGRKIVKVLHNGSDYQLETIFEKSSPEHVFICDGVDMNLGRTGAVQKELIREHFKMTQEIHDVLTGEEKFTAMSPLRRREWITKLSDTDFTYVLGLYSKVKRGARDAAAVVKHNNGRLITETSKLMDAGDLETLVNRSKHFTHELNCLLQECNSNYDNVQVVNNLLMTEHKSLEQFIANGIKKINVHAPDLPAIIRSEHELDDLINHYNSDINGYHVTMEELSRIFQHYEVQMRELKSVEGMDEGYLRTRAKELEEHIAVEMNKLQTGEPYSRIGFAGAAGLAVLEFRGQVQDLDAEQRELYAIDVVGERRGYLERLHQAKNLLSNNMGNVEGRLQHIESCQESGCPKCGHTFKNGVDPSEQERLQQSLSKGNEKLTDINKQIVDIQEFMEKANRHQAVVNRVEKFRRTNSEASNFWGYIDRAGGLELGKDLIPAINLYMKDIEVAKTIAGLQNDLNPIREALATIDSISADKGSIREEYYFYRTRISELTDRIRKENAELDLLVDYSLRQTAFTTFTEAVKVRLDSMSVLQEKLIEGFRQSEIRGLIKDDQIALAMVETSLTETEIQQGIVNDIRKEISTVSVEEQAYKILADALSPVDGLIAEQISIYINAIIDRINAVIARVWGYNMAIKPCDVSDGDLDYRFPLYTVSADNDIPDISKGSDSQVDIVNQAFRLIVYKFLDLHDYPLYLDELGRSFDEVHRHNLIPAIKDMIDDSTYSQIFMISHYADGQNSYPNSEIIVLDDAHVNPKRAFNQHVTIA